MSARSITVLGKKINYEIKDVDISTLKYYKENPRINYIISKYPKNKVTQEFIEQELLKRDSTKELIKDLEANKGLLDEIYVLNDEVIEGNTRLCAYRWLSRKYPDKPIWKSVKARVLKYGVTEEELFYILSTFHIKGKKEWDAYEKAAYIYKMIKVLNKPPEVIAKQLGKQRKSIEAMLKAYEAMSQKYLKDTSDEQLINGGREELKKYSYFESFYLQNELSKRAEETPGFLDEFVEWVREDRLGKAQDVRQLPKILSHKKASRTFYESVEDKAFRDAMDILYKDKPEKVEKFYKKLRDFRELLKETEVNKVKDEIEDNKNKKNELKQCLKDLKRFCKEVGLE